MKTSKELMRKLHRSLIKIPNLWDGRKAIKEMKEAHYPHWRQMEWIGWYFQYLCEKNLSAFVEIPGPKYGRVEFDGYAEIPWDFKAHPLSNMHGRFSDEAVANDREATTHAIRRYGAAGVILAIGNATFNDEDRSFQRWHQNLKGGLSRYEKERMKRNAPSRLRKTAFELHEVRFIEIDRKSIQRYASFQQGFRNSNGNPRRAKVLLNLKITTPVDVIRYKKL